jgi:hypothetical protein
MQRGPSLLTNFSIAVQPLPLQHWKKKIDSLRKVFFAGTEPLLLTGSEKVVLRKKPKVLSQPVFHLPVDPLRGSFTMPLAVIVLPSPQVQVEPSY